MNCDHCINQPKLAYYRYTSQQGREKYICKPCSTSSFFKKHYMPVQLIPVNVNKVRRYNLPLSHTYILAGTNALATGEYTSCENCNRVINNIALVRNEKGKEFTVGLDCAGTLSYCDTSDYMKIQEAEAIARKTRGVVSKVKKWKKAGTYSVIEKDETVYLYEKAGVTEAKSFWTYRMKKAHYEKYFQAI